MRNKAPLPLEKDHTSRPFPTPATDGRAVVRRFVIKRRCSRRKSSPVHVLRFGRSDADPSACLSRRWSRCYASGRLFPLVSVALCDSDRPKLLLEMAGRGPGFP